MSSAPSIENCLSAVKNALVVDADPQIQTLLWRALEPGSWAVLSVPDNLAALATARSRAFDLIVTSDKTSGREDIELLRQIRRVRPHTTSDHPRGQRYTLGRDRGDAGTRLQLLLQAVFIGHARRHDSIGDRGTLLGRWHRGRLRNPRIDSHPGPLPCENGGAADALSQRDRRVDPERDQVANAFREMLLNAIEHGGRLDPNQYVEIEYVRARHMVTCHITDPGPGFTLKEIPHAAIANPTEDPIRHIAIREKARDAAGRVRRSSGAATC
jgi:Histidine kinase-like ATPase domain